MSNKEVILVTGANGLLGRSCCEILSRRASVVAVVRQEPKQKVEGVKYVVGDISLESTFELFPRRVNRIIHLAQSDKFREFPIQAADIFGVNVASTAMLLDYALKAQVKSFVYASSGGVYGSGKNAFKENLAINSQQDLGFYLGSKLCGEILVKNYSAYMNVQVIRPFFMYGKRQKRSMLIPRLVDSVRSHTPITLQGNEGLKINPIHVDDAVRCVVGLIEIDQSLTINVAGARVMSLREVAETIGQELDIMPQFNCQDAIPQDVVGDISLLQKLDLSPCIDFAEGIKEML